MKRTRKTCIFAVLETCKKAELCSPYVGYHEKSRPSSTRSEGRDSEWPIELSLWRLCRAARSRVLSRSLLRLPLEMESLLVVYVADREIDFPCFIIFEAFFGDWEQIGKSSLSVLSSLNGKKYLVNWVACSRGGFLPFISINKTSFCPYFKIRGFINF